MTEVLSSLERTGIKIDPTVLAEIEKEYRDEMNALEVKLQRMAEEAMGDTPVNLNSADDRSMLFYSRRVLSKKRWASIFNLGLICLRTL